MRIHYSIYLSLYLLIVPNIHAMESTAPQPETICICWDVDGVISDTILPAYQNLPNLNQQSRDFESWNRAVPLLNDLVTNNPQLKDTFIEECKKDHPFLICPVYPMIELINTLKNNGYPVVAATNQRYSSDHRLRHARYRKIMAVQHSIDFKKLFPITLTANYKDQLYKKTRNDFLIQSPGIYTPKSCTAKPFPAYYLTLKQLINQKHTHVKKIIHIDDVEDNVIGAKDTKHFEGIHFNINLRTADSAQLAAAITKLKADLRSHGVNCD